MIKSPKFLRGFLINSTLDGIIINEIREKLTSFGRDRKSNSETNRQKAEKHIKYIYSFKTAEMLPYVRIVALPTRAIMISSAWGFSQDTPHFYADQELSKLDQKKKKKIIKPGQQNTKWLIPSFKIISILNNETKQIYSAK